MDDTLESCAYCLMWHIYVTHTSCNNFVYCIRLHVQRTDMQMNVLCRVWGQDEHILWLLDKFTANLLEIGVAVNTYWDITVRRNGLWIRCLCSLLFSVALVHNVGLSDCRGKKGTTFRILKEYEKDLFLDSRRCLPKFHIKCDFLMKFVECKSFCGFQ